MKHEPKAEPPEMKTPRVRMGWAIIGVFMIVSSLVIFGIGVPVFAIPALVLGVLIGLGFLIWHKVRPSEVEEDRLNLK